MNFENPTPAPEKEPRILTLEEIKIKIEKLCGKENPEIVRTLEDENGVYLHEVVTMDDKGDASLISYRRSGNYQETKAAHTVIDVAYFIGPLSGGMCVGGDTLSDYDENSDKWTDIK